jgi:hypothetical protein
MRRIGGVVVVLVAATSAASRSASAAGVHVRAGRIAVSGTARVDIPLSRHAKAFRSYALSADRRYGPGDWFVGSSTQSVARRIAHVWLSFRDDATTGPEWLLGCAAGVPTKRGCKALSRVSVAAPPQATVATPTLAGAPLVATVTATQAGSWSVTAPDGTTYTLNVPAEATLSKDVLTMQPVGALTPASAAGRLVDGVMISPAGAAPPGATLTVTPAPGVSANAYLVGFGGIDPSGAAFRLPIILGRTATIPVTQLGGYGIAVSSAAARDAAATVPACSDSGARSESATTSHRAQLTSARPAGGSRPITSCSSAEQRIQQLQEALTKQLAAERQSQLAGTSDGTDTGALIDAAASAQQAVTSEMNGILAQPPTEAGTAQLEVLSASLSGGERQLELLGDTSHTATTLSILERVVRYGLTYAQQVCNSAPGGANSIDVVFQAQRLFGAERQLELIGSSADFGPVIEQASACFQRARFNLSASGGATVDDGFETGSVKLSADTVQVTGADVQARKTFLLTGKSGSLTYSDHSIAIDPNYSQLGESASFSSTGGVLDPGNTIDFALNYRIRCDQNRQFVIDKSMKLYLLPDGLWNDTQTVQLAGPILQGPSWSGAMTAAWAQVHKLDRTAIVVPVEQPPNPSFPSEPPFSETNSGTLALGSWSYNTTISAQSLPIGS